MTEQPKSNQNHFFWDPFTQIDFDTFLKKLKNNQLDTWNVKKLPKVRAGGGQKRKFF